MALWVDLEPFGYGNFDTMMELVAHRAGHMGPAMNDVVEDLQRFVHRRFWGDNSWPPLAPSTIASKTRRGFPAVPMIATGRLHRALTGRTQDSVHDVRDDGFEFGTNLPYAGYVTRGTSRIPARPIFEFGPEDEQRWERILEDYLEEVVT